MAYQLTDEDRNIARQLGMQQFQQGGGTFQKPKQSGGGVGSFLLGLLPGGSLIDKGIRGEQITGGDIATEAALSLVPFGLGKIAKGAKGLRGANAANSAAKPGILNRISTGAKDIDARASGLGVGQKLSGSTITPQRSQELYDFARSRGVKAGSPMRQSRQAESLLKGTTTSLDDLLGTINRPTVPGELTTLADEAMAKVAGNAAVTGSTKTLGKFSDKISKATDIKDLEAIRREADDLAYSATGAKKTSAAAQAKAVRETIDNFVSGMSKDYKLAKGDYRNAKDLLELTSRSVGKGGIDIFGNKVGSSVVPAAISKGSSILSKVGGGTSGNGIMSNPVAKFLAPQAGVRVGADVLGLRSGEEPAPGTDAMNALGAPQTSPITPNGTGSIYTQEAAAADIQRDLAETGGENMDKYMKLYEFMNPVSSEKPLSAEASKVLSNANSGLDSLSQLQGMIQEGGVPLGTVLPGRDLLGGLGANILGTSGFDTAAKNITDVITRLRTGAALTESEEAFYKSQLPQAFDPPEVQAQKMQMFQDLFSSIASRTGSSGGSDSESLLRAAGY